MNLITNITSYPLQNQTVPLPDGSVFNFTIYYVPLQIGWFITNLTYKTFILNGMRICNNPNMLYQWQNQLPFGLACFTQSNREPTQQQDFSSGASGLYLLSQQECEDYRNYLRTGILPA